MFKRYFIRYSCFLDVNYSKISKSNIFCRFICLEVPDFDNERLLRRSKSRENFDKIFPQLKLPFKLRHHEKSREFIRERLEKYPEGFQSISLDQYEKIWLSEPDQKRQQKIVEDIKIILMYYNNVLRTSLFAPSSIPIDDMRKMMFKYEGYSSRLRYVQFLFVREFDCWCQNLNEQQASLLRNQAELEDYFEHIGCFNPVTDQLQYGYWRNTLFTRYFRRARHLQTLNPLRQAQMFGQPIVIDCSLEQMMADYEILSCSRQISWIYHQNRYSRYPFRLLFTGYDSEKNRSYEYLKKNMFQFIHQTEFCFNIHRESYQELLPGERFIYLSPDSRKIMTEYDPEAVYIIGALVSKTYKATLTLNKARQEGLECLRLPIHQYVQLKPMVKRTLSFRAAFQILLELKHGANWSQAFLNSIQPHKISHS